MTKQRDVSLQNKSSLLASNSNSRPNDSPESARVTQMLTDRCFYLLSEYTEQTEIGRGWSMSPALMCASAEYQPSPSGYSEIRSYTSSRSFLTELQQSRECARACLPESAARVQIIRARVCFLSCGSGSAVDVKRYWSPRCVQSVRYVSVPSTGSVINEGSSMTNAEPWWMTFTSSSSSSFLCW